MYKSLTLTKRGESGKLHEETVEAGLIVTAGSDPGSTIVLAGSDIAPEQFIVFDEESETVLMNRAAGTSVNGRDLKPGARVALKVGDKIETGDFVLLFGESGSEDVPAPAPSAEQRAKAATAPGETGTPTSEKVKDDEPGLKAAIAGRESGAATEPAKEAIVETADETVAEIKTEKEKDPAVDKDFSKILHELREEDTFSFHLRDAEDVVQRIPLLKDQLWIGTQHGRVAIIDQEENLEEVFARVKKDWSGVVIFPKSEQQTLLNGGKLAEPKRLKNDDVLSLIDDFEGEELAASIVFHEPVSLLALSSILPGDIPEPVSPAASSPSANISLGGESTATVAGSPGQVSTGPRLVFGYYTILEIIVMAFGTLVTAAIIFFVLEMV